MTNLFFALADSDSNALSGGTFSKQRDNIMPVLAAFTTEFSPAQDVLDKVTGALGYREIDSVLLESASKQFDVDAGKLLRAMTGPPFIFNKMTRKRERYLAYLNVALAELLENDNLVLRGFATHLVPREITHVLKVCLLEDPEARIERLIKEKGVSSREAQAMVRDSDEQRGLWTSYLFNLPPWDRTLYDIKLPLHSTPEEKAVEIIRENLSKKALLPTESSWDAVKDFKLAAQAGLALTDAGLYHKVVVHHRSAEVIVDEYVLRWEHLEGEIRRQVETVVGIEEVKVKTGPNYRPPSMFANVEFDLPEKVLLVDDEKDFVMTLSERLVMRDLEPAVAYDGEQALEILQEEEPEVMILDLKMPGIDGIEVLRKVKAEHPDVEVVILTGHGSDKDRDLCMQLGAFAYLEKPVDIEVLSGTLRQANEKILAKKSGEDQA